MNVSSPMTLHMIEIQFGHQMENGLHLNQHDPAIRKSG